MKVLCINDDFTEQRSWKNWHMVKDRPKKGLVYTVERKRKYADGDYGLRLRELQNTYSVSFHSKRFVPIAAISKTLRVQLERRGVCSTR